MRNRIPIDQDGLIDTDDGRGASPSPPSSTPAGDTGELPAVGDLGVVFQSPAPPQGASTGGTPGSSPGPVSGSASPFVINVIYDSSVNSAPAAFKTGIQAAVSFLESVITTPVTVNIDVGYGEIDGQALGADALGESETFLNNYSYASIKSALANVDPTAAANLPASAPGSMWLATGEAKALGLAGASSNIDAFAGFSSSFPFAYDPNNRAVAGEYDFIGVVEHEFTEDMGRIDLFGATLAGGGQTFANTYSLLDLDHYTSPGVHTFTGSSPNYFSVNNGVTNLDNFNSNPGGDLGDWASSAGSDSFLAFSPSGEEDVVSQADIAEMNALGFAVTPPPSPPTVTPRNLQETSGEAPVALSTLLTYSDPSGAPAVSWRIQDVASDGTNALLLNGVPLNASVTVTLTAAQFAQLAVGPVTSSHQIWANASDGTFSSTPVNFTVTPPPPAQRPSGSPTVTPRNLQETSGEAPVTLSTLLTYSDPAGAPAVSWRIQDVASDGTSALLLNGVALNASSTVVLTAAQFAQVAVGPVTSSHQIWANASDGTFSSTAVSLTVTPPSPGSGASGPPTVTPRNLQETTGEAPVAVSTLLTYSDPSGVPAVSWRIQDVASDGTKALLLNGVALNASSTVVLTAAQFAQLAVGPVTSSHQIWANASDGTFSSAPVNFTVTPPPSASILPDHGEADSQSSVGAGASQLIFGDSGSPGANPVVIADGGSADLVYSAAPVSFIGSSGTLQLDNSAGFGGQISGFSAQDQIDLRDIVFSPQTAVGYAADPAKTGGNLTVAAGGQAANLALLGNYTGSQFAISSDGQGGTLVTLQQMAPTGDTALATPQKHT
jgi:hypothetical protein